MKRPTRAETAAAVGIGARQGQLLAAEPWPDGFAYREEVISPDEERALAEPELALLPLTPFAFRGFLARRRVVSFGWRYDYAGRALRQSDKIPGLLIPLRERAAEIAGVPARSLQQVLITEYAPGAAIGWHRDKPMFEDVIALSFLAQCTLRLRRRRGRLRTAARSSCCRARPPRAPRVGTQHSARGRASLFGDVSQLHSSMTVPQICHRILDIPINGLSWAGVVTRPASERRPCGACPWRQQSARRAGACRPPAPSSRLFFRAAMRSTTLSSFAGFYGFTGLPLRSSSIRARKASS